MVVCEFGDLCFVFCSIASNPFEALVMPEMIGN